MPRSIYQYDGRVGEDTCPIGFQAGGHANQIAKLGEVKPDCLPSYPAYRVNRISLTYFFPDDDGFFITCRRC